MCPLTNPPRLLANPEALQSGGRRAVLARICSGFCFTDVQ
jgi:hypothetical protein